MTIPIILNGLEAGKLHIRPDGLYTLMEATLPPSKDMTRLWLIGEGESFPLGLMEPRPNGRYLLRRYSRSQLRSLPKNIEYASDCPCRGRLHAPPQQQEKGAVPAENEAPSSSPSPWHPRPDGTLIDPHRRLLALPCALRRAQPGLRLINIEGREYMVFRY